MDGKCLILNKVVIPGSVSNLKNSKSKIIQNVQDYQQQGDGIFTIVKNWSKSMS